MSSNNLEAKETVTPPQDAGQERSWQHVSRQITAAGASPGERTKTGAGASEAPHTPKASLDKDGSISFPGADHNGPPAANLESSGGQTGERREGSSERSKTRDLFWSTEPGERAEAISKLNERVNQDKTLSDDKGQDHQSDRRLISELGKNIFNHDTEALGNLVKNSSPEQMKRATEKLQEYIDPQKRLMNISSGQDGSLNIFREHNVGLDGWSTPRSDWHSTGVKVNADGSAQAQDYISRYDSVPFVEGQALAWIST
jgi:hypothetical protein